MLYYNIFHSRDMAGDVAVLHPQLLHPPAVDAFDFMLAFRQTGRGQ